MISLRSQTILQFLSQLDEVSHDDFTRNNQEVMEKEIITKIMYEYINLSCINHNKLCYLQKKVMNYE